MLDENITLRKLQMKDAMGMLEWMQDKSVIKYLRIDTTNASHERAENFIKAANDSSKQSIHMAIVNEEDEYLGTISLKNIDKKVKSAEYAISMRSVAQGKGIAAKATRLILEKAFQEMQMSRIYLNVLSDNQRAIMLYEKCGFKYEGEFKNHICIRGEIKSLKWYAIMKEEYFN